MQKISLILVFIFLLVGCGQFRSPKFQPATRKEEVTQVYTEPKKEPFSIAWPVKDIRITRGFQKKPKHQGLDLDGRKGDKVYSAHDGVVIYKGRRFKGYGKMIIVEHDDKWATLYAHLSGYNVKIGDKVDTGDLIGYIGNTGRSTGSHLHFELIHKKQPIDPLLLLPEARNIANN